MATAAVLRQRVFDNLYGSAVPERPTIQRINGAVNDTSETVIVDSGTPISINDIVEFESGEQGFIYGKSSNTLSVYRGWNGTTAANIADNSFIKVNPRWTIKKVDDELNNVLRDLSAQGLYILGEGTDITLVAGQDVYELTETDVHEKHGALAVFYQEASNSEIVGVPFLNIFDPTLETLSSGFGVRLLSWGNNAAGDALTVLYAKKIDALADSDAEPLLEMALVLGATGYVLGGAEGPRIHDPGRFTDRTVQPGQPIRDGSFFLGQYQRTVWRYRAFLQTKEANLPGARARRARRFRP